MADIETKTKDDYINDVLSQLKEIRHYAKNNTETLSAQWLAFDSGEFKDKELAGKIDTLLNAQGKLHDEVEASIADIEILVNKAAA
ncbi:hypothetical protein [Erwinia sp. JUb26]|uniref:hypothetical protein n=1 Tax=Erwinia sp. JUb26 TaxID=2485126 RepID=UPI000F4803C0|nr:hypothetical protein [Erwinia sp. JUb26]ROR11161.1 hypothetical protein EC836_10374 [Erwinia sp. JUb26]